MTKPEKIDIAIIGNRDQAALVRLAGVEKYRIIDDGEDINEKVKEALMELSDDSSVGIIMIPEEWTGGVTETLKHIRESRKRSAIVIEIPSGFKAKEQDVKGYYKAYTKKLIGFNVDI